MQIHASWFKLDRIDNYAKKNGYAEIALLDTNVPVSGISMYQLGKKGIKEWLSWKSKTRGDILTKRVGPGSYSFVTNGFDEYADYIYENLCLPSMRITDAMTCWKAEKDLDIIPAIPDFIFDEMESVMNKNYYDFVDYYKSTKKPSEYIDPKRMWRWVNDVTRRPEALFGNVHTPFGKMRSKRAIYYHIDNHLSEYERGVWEEASPLLGRDPGDMALFLTALRLLKTTDLEISIVSDNTRDFSHQLRYVLEDNPLGTRHVKHYTTKEFCSILLRKNVSLLAGEMEERDAFAKKGRIDWAKKVPYD